MTSKKTVQHDPSTVKPATYGRFARSIHPAIMKPGRPCSLKRHFAGYLRQFIGYVDLLARRDYERFVWAGTQDISDHMLTAEQNLDPPSRRMVMFCRAKARELGIISDQQTRLRHGRM